MNGRESTRDLSSANVPSGWVAAMLFLVLLCVAAGALVLLLFDPEKHAFYPFCLFHKVTGLLCPGCGSLRAFHHLLNGEVTLALRHNLLVVLSLPLFIFLGARLVLSSFGRRVPPLIVPRIWIWVGLALLLLFGILRNMPFARAVWLAP